MAFGLQRGPEQHSGQLTDIARPAVPHQHGQSSLPIDRGACQAPRRSGSANAGPGRDIAAALAQRGMVTVVAEIRPARPARKSSGSARLVVAITHIDRVRSVAADRADFAGGQDPVQLFLGFAGQGADLVEQERAAVRLDDTADPLGKAPGKAPGMAEQLAFDECWRRLPCSRPGRRSGAFELGWRWMARAKVSLPQPASPTIRIGRRLRAALAATASAARNSGVAPTS